MNQFRRKTLLYLIEGGLALVLFLFPWSATGQAPAPALISDDATITFNPGLQANTDLLTVMQQTDAPISSPGSQPPLNIAFNSLILAAPAHPYIIGISFANSQQRIPFTAPDLPQINQSAFIVSAGASAELSIKFVQPSFEVAAPTIEPTITPTQTPPPVAPTDTAQTTVPITSNEVATETPAPVLTATSTNTALTTELATETVQPVPTSSTSAPPITSEPPNTGGILNFIGLICTSVATILAALIGVWNRNSIKGAIEWIKKLFGLGKTPPPTPSNQTDPPVTTVQPPLTQPNTTLFPPQPDKTNKGLREKLAQSFNEGELRTLCSDLGIDYEDLLPGGKTDKVRELIGYVEKHGRMQTLINVLKTERPEVKWEENG